LYNFIISKIFKSFKTNVLNDNVKINSMHMGHDNGSVQAALNHLFYSSNIDDKILWRWVSLKSADNKVLWRELHCSSENIVTYLTIKPPWEQCQFIINKIEKKIEKFNLFVFQLPNMFEEFEIRQSYLFLLILVLRFLDSHGVLLMELQLENKWSLLTFNIIAMCAMIFDNVYLTKYNIERTHIVLVCKNKKKNLHSSNLIKKLLKILNSTTHCIIDIKILPVEWIERIKSLITYPILPIPFEQIINDIGGNLKINEHPML